MRVNGVVVSGPDEGEDKADLNGFRPLRARVLLIALIGIAAAATVLASLGLLTSCSSGIDAAIRADGSARLSVHAEIPPLLEAKLRKLSSLPEAAPLIDLAQVRKELSEKPGIGITSLSAPGAASIKGEFTVKSLANLAAYPELASAGVLRLAEGPTWTELRFRIERGRGKALLELLPGIDPDLIEALSPPALAEEDPATPEDYRTMLSGLVGTKGLAALDATNISLKISSPAAVTDSGGGVLAGNELRVTIPFLELLILEKPIEFWIRWKK